MRSYIAELEYLITDILVPVYDKYHAERGTLPDYSQTHRQLLKRVCRRKALPALLKPKEK